MEVPKGMLIIQIPVCSYMCIRFEPDSYAQSPEAVYCLNYAAEATARQQTLLQESQQPQAKAMKT